jgi:hypothetical protein
MIPLGVLFAASDLHLANLTSEEEMKVQKTALTFVSLLLDLELLC